MKTQIEAYVLEFPNLNRSLIRLAPDFCPNPKFLEWTIAYLSIMQSHHDHPDVLLRGVIMDWLVTESELKFRLVGSDMVAIYDQYNLVNQHVTEVLLAVREMVLEHGTVISNTLVRSGATFTDLWKYHLELQPRKRHWVLLVRYDYPLKRLERHANGDPHSTQHAGRENYLCI